MNEEGINMRSATGSLASVLLIALLAPAAPAAAQGYDAKNADKVDGLHATTFNNTPTKRKNKLVAANRTGFLPNNIIKMAPNSAKLGGKTLAEVIAAATDVYTAGIGLRLDGNRFSLSAAFRLPQDCVSGEVVAAGAGDWECLQFAGAAYTAGDGLDLTNSVFSIAPGGVSVTHLGFDPATQAELNEHKASGDHDARYPTQSDLDAHKSSADHDGRYFTKNELQTPGSINTGGNPVDWTKLKGVPLGIADGVDADTTYTAGTGLALGGTTFSANFAGTGIATTIARSDHNHDATLWRRAGNGGTNPTSEFIGTLDNQALNFRVNNARVMRYEPDATSPNIVGGFSGNSVTAGALGATVAGGGASSNANRVTDNYGTVGGGNNNRAGDAAGTTADNLAATVGGGFGNVASGGYATVGGGFGNVASGPTATVGGGDLNAASDYSATVSGGQDNVASDAFATVGGGRFNIAGGENATVGGGEFNAAHGNYSFAGGRRAKANENGTFVWGDSTNADVNSFGTNTFSVRSSGGAVFYSNAAMTTGVTLAANGGSWSSLSDINMKEDFKMVDGRATLEALAETPIGTWRYLGEDASVLHMGPSAQDFKAAFGLGNDERRITTIDADGVALSAIQGLYELVQEQQSRIDRLEKMVMRRSSTNRVR